MARSTRQVTISPSATVSAGGGDQLLGQGLRDGIPALARPDHGAQGGKDDRIHGYIPR